MIDNLSECFNKEYQFYLDSITFNRIDNGNSGSQLQLNCTDQLQTNLYDRTVKIDLTRIVSFQPENLFSLSVSFGAILTIKEEKYHEYDWRSIDLSKEFRNSGNFVLDNLMSRITLLIGQITSSFGQQPLILSPAGTQPLVE